MFSWKYQPRCLDILKIDKLSEFNQLKIRWSQSKANSKTKILDASFNLVASAAQDMVWRKDTKWTRSKESKNRCSDLKLCAIDSTKSYLEHSNCKGTRQMLKKAS